MTVRHRNRRQPGDTKFGGLDRSALTSDLSTVPQQTLRFQRLKQNKLLYKRNRTKNKTIEFFYSLLGVILKEWFIRFLNFFRKKFFQH